MGGRGAVSGFVPELPNYQRATIAEAKITKYLLDPERKHYPEFVAVGYSADNPERLKNDLLDGLRNNRAKAYEPDENGATAFEVDMMLGVTRKARFRTGWRIDAWQANPRFITAHRIGANRK